jgi:hypothetical protein
LASECTIIYNRCNEPTPKFMRCSSITDYTPPVPYRRLSQLLFSHNDLPSMDKTLVLGKACKRSRHVYQLGEFRLIRPLQLLSLLHMSRSHATDLKWKILYRSEIMMRSDCYTLFRSTPTQLYYGTRYKICRWRTTSRDKDRRSNRSI